MTLVYDVDRGEGVQAQEEGGVEGLAEGPVHALELVADGHPHPALRRDERTDHPEDLDEVVVHVLAVHGVVGTDDVTDDDTG